jgi:hypothetical protein
VHGTVSYDKGYTGSFSAVLEYEDTGWRLYIVNLDAPPDKFDMGASANG